MEMSGYERTWQAGIWLGMHASFLPRGKKRGWRFIALISVRRGVRTKREQSYARGEEI